MRTILLALFLALMVSHPVKASDRAWAAIERGDLETAVAVWQPQASRGDVNAMLGLAHVASMQGDDAAAADWYRQAAVRGDAAASVLLASAYLEGRGVTRDPVRAYAWYETAAQRGHANAVQARDFAAKWLSPEQVGLARAMIVRWHEDDFASAR
ncbi:MAG: tetratricopeptide repeat protein [Alphaproteobacteria bacterium]|nr:tetratricopeptide repeat protein [Alphaproteobacteria bacterium]